MPHKDTEDFLRCWRCEDEYAKKLYILDLPEGKFRVCERCVLLLASQQIMQDLQEQPCCMIGDLPCPACHDELKEDAPELSC